MEVTYLGYVVLPLGLWMAVVNPRVLFLTMIFFVPFSASAVINFESVTFGLQPYHYLAILLMGRTAADLFRKRIPLLRNRGQVAALSLLGIFWIATVLSLAAAAFRGEVRLYNLTQFVYLTFGVVLTAIVAIRARSPQIPREAMLVYIGAGVFVSVWGLIQVALYHLGIPYPSMLFNSSRSDFADGYLQVLQGSVKRISSVAVETSVLARVLVSASALAGVAMLLGPTRKRVLMSVSLCLLVYVLLLSTSTTGYVGLVALCAVLAARYFGRLRTLLPVLVVMLLLVGTITTERWMAIAMMTIDKIDSVSFQERSASVAKAYGAFLQRPILGAGWGNVPSHDLVVKLLSNTGLVGFVLFASFVGFLLLAGSRCSGNIQRRSQLSNEDNDKEAEPWNADLAVVDGLVVTVVILVLMDVVAGFSYVFGQLWVVFGLLIAGLNLGGKPRLGGRI